MKGFPVFKTIILCFIVLAVCSFSQLKLQAKTSKTEKQLRSHAEDYFLAGYYGSAQEMYERLDSLNPNNLEYQYNLAVCYTKTFTHQDRAVEILESLNESGVNKVGKYKLNEGELDYYLGKSYHLSHSFDKAIAAYQSCIDYDKVDYDILDDAALSIKMCKNAKEIVRDPIDVEVQNLGQPINSKYDEHSALVSADEEYLVFTTKRPGNVGGKMDIQGYEDEYGMYFEDIYVARRNGDIWRKPYNIIDTINTEAQEATTGLSADGQTLLLYISSFGRFGDVYKSKKIGDRWTIPQALPKPINTNMYMEAHASLSGTENEIYFTSDRPGGFGGRDIYVSKKQPDGTWGEAINLGPDINTEQDETGPYIHVDGETLFFSSKGHKSMGGFDIFKSKFNGEGWDQPQNIGYPLNTAGDDVYFVLSASGKKGYFTSRREGGLGGSDIYTVEVNYEFGEPVVVVLKGIVNELGQAVDAIIIVTDIDKNLVVGEYQSNASSGDYLLALPPGANYDVHFLSEDGTMDKHVDVFLKDVEKYIQIEHDIDMKGDIGKTAKMEKIIADPKTGEINVKKSQSDLLKIEDVLRNNPDLKLEVAVFTDTTNSNKLNLASALGRSLKKQLAADGTDTSRVVPRIVSKANPFVDQEIEVRVLQGGIADQIVVKDNQVYVNKNTLEKTMDKDPTQEDVVAKFIKEINDAPTTKPKAVEQKKPLVKENLNETTDKIDDMELGAKPPKEPAKKPIATNTDWTPGYKVQIAAFRTALPPTNGFFKNTPNIKVRKWDDGLTRYTVGLFDSFEEANEFRKELLPKFYDAFIVKH